MLLRLKYNYTHLHSAWNRSRLNQIHGKINNPTTRRKRDGQYGREKFYSLVIHGCPRITFFALVRLNSVERMHCEKRKDLSYRRNEFRSFGCFYHVASRIFPFALVSKHPSNPYVSFCPRCARSFPISFSLPCRVHDKLLFARTTAERAWN